ncbi:MAG: hypothetical protein ACXWJO_05635, partial [Xanthobacteraceae bacterium]
AGNAPHLFTEPARLHIGPVEGYGKYTERQDNEREDYGLHWHRANSDNGPLMQLWERSTVRL